MLRVDTLERLIVLPSDPLKLVCNDQPACKLIGQYDNAPEVEELVAYMKGEECDYGIVQKVLLALYPAHRVPIVRHECKTTHTPFTVKCTDGEVTEYNAGTLRRRFQLIDDYIADTGEDTITLPYTTKEFVNCVVVEGCLTLDSCFHCLMHLNPKSNMYPFYYNMTWMEKENIQYLTNRLTQADLHQLYLTSMRRKMNLPSTDPLVLLTVFPSLNQVNQLTRSLLCDYPSYFFTSRRTDHWYEREASFMLDTLLTSDWSKDAHTLVNIGEDRRKITRTILEILARVPMERSVFLRLMSMIGIRQGKLGNMKQEALPYLLPPLDIEGDPDIVVDIGEIVDRHIPEGPVVKLDAASWSMLYSIFY